MTLRKVADGQRWQHREHAGASFGVFFIVGGFGMFSTLSGQTFSLIVALGKDNRSIFNQASSMRLIAIVPRHLPPPSATHPLIPSLLSFTFPFPFHPLDGDWEFTRPAFCGPRLLGQRKFKIEPNSIRYKNISMKCATAFVCLLFPSLDPGTGRPAPAGSAPPVRREVRGVSEPVEASDGAYPRHSRGGS